MKTESPALAEQRGTTSNAEKNRADTDLEFSAWFSVAVQTYFFGSFVSAIARLVWDPFSELIPKWRPQFSSTPTSLWLVFNSHLFLVISPHQLTFKPESSPNFRQKVIPRLRRRFGTSGFSDHFKLQKSFTRVGWPPKSALAWLTWVSWLPYKLSVCFFLIIFLLFLFPLPQKFSL